ncbi:hypothetical protein AKJ55_00800 [candidate division MSBL1 archaeon SCGC-AAA382M17]|uniref:Helicase/UvrB N-terminal domain-containing protein n=1 Tax=candidate division MSBL1 archaeon SCGC-AAA382M17 TaxID=1698284 RepID=A0ABR5TKH3_9EURY|nr:hypothetical protein AKJ55_00800 [candidate division MSBL1 archaeon SCGC-AAA382M17]
MPEEERIDPNDLVLRLNEDTRNFDISKYEDFIMALCGDREYQMDSIRNIIKFYLSDNYKNIGELVRENYENREDFKEIFSNPDQLLEQVSFKDKLSCTIDLATATGKTWVMYGVAQIMLCEGKVDRVLVLAPSLTIKRELLEKFRKFANNDHLKNSLPNDSEYKNPRIIQSSQTIKVGDICIDNVHKTYDHVSSSIDYSLTGVGEKTLIINDEAHHLLNPKIHASRIDKQSLLEWEKFLKNEDYGFRYILNSSGTPYKGNNYFKDVLYRYSVRQAIEDRYIKDINYLEKDESKNWDEKFEAIYGNHSKNKEKYPEAKKHITIFVTNRIKRTDEIAEDIIEFLMEKEELEREKAEEKVLPVTSSSKHEENRKILETVDTPENSVEWIVSVSMLTEGWDVDNVFQIVPKEERAFNSKLLISQVLGRGLRVPPPYRDEDSPHPEVVVYNHEAWSEKIDNLVREVAEISVTITSRILEERDEYNFNLYLMDPKKRIGKKKVKASENDISLPKTFGLKSESDIREQRYRSADTGEETVRRTEVPIKKYTVEEAANDIYNHILLADKSHGTKFSEKIDKSYIKTILEKELEDIGEDKVTEDNLQRAKNSFNVIYRKVTGYRPVIEPAYKKPRKINTSEMSTSHISLSELKRNKAVIYSKESLEASSEKEKDKINEAVNESKVKNMIVDDGVYKTPLNITFLQFSNEIDFGKRLKREENADNIDAWVKSRDKGFYPIPYIYRPGTHSKQKKFNPDFLIKKGDDILVIEIKSDEDTSLKNQAKLRGAKNYFEKLNEEVDDQNYHFYFLSPSDFTGFLDEVIRKENYEKRYKLHADLLKKARAEVKEERQ